MLLAWMAMHHNFHPRQRPERRIGGGLVEGWWLSSRGINPWKSLKINWKSLEINENQSLEINQNHWKLLEINENH
jgi:hypothetical protein